MRPSAQPQPDLFCTDRPDPPADNLLECEQTACRASPQEEIKNRPEMGHLRPFWESAGGSCTSPLGVDENPATATRFNVMSIPTLLVLKNGREMERIIGVQP